MPLPDGGRVYGDGSDSSIGTQLRTDYYQKKALIEMKKEVYFGQLADTVAMPKNMGKTIKRYHYMPLLDDANINDQGIDAAGLSVNQSVSIKVRKYDGLDGNGNPIWRVPNIPDYYGRTVSGNFYFVGEGVDAATAGDDAITKAIAWMQAPTASGGLGLTLVGATNDLKFIDGVNQTDGLAYVKGFRFYTGLTNTELDTSATAIDTDAVPESGNLYGSSKDVGTVSGKLPALTEVGGRVNRVGFSRVELEGTFYKFGFFDEYTQESLDFDTDAELMTHINREMLFAANEMTEDALQIDLLNSAGTVRFAGDATQDSELSGETGSITEVTYNDLMRLSIDLDNTRTPKHTKVITGTRMVDTKVVRAARVMYIGSELTLTVENMVDSFGDKAFIPVAHYAAAGSVLNGEIGTIGHFRIVVVPEMMHWSGAGATETSSNAGYRATAGNYDIFPMLVVGDEAFTTIGFQTSGKSVKFKIYSKKPGEATADRNDPYGETGFMSIKWYYGFMALRTERIALVKTVALW